MTDQEQRRISLRAHYKAVLKLLPTMDRIFDFGLFLTLEARYDIDDDEFRDLIAARREELRDAE